MSKWRGSWVRLGEVLHIVTPQKKNYEHHITSRKFDKTLSPQHIFNPMNYTSTLGIITFILQPFYFSLCNPVTGAPS